MIPRFLILKLDCFYCQHQLIHFKYNKRYLTVWSLSLTNANRALPENIIVYKHAVLLQKLCNTQTPSIEWVDYISSKFLIPVTMHVTSIKTTNSKLEYNIIISRPPILNRKIELTDFNLWLHSFIVIYKNMLLTA